MGGQQEHGLDHHYSSEQCWSKPQWDTSWHLLERLLWKWHKRPQGHRKRTLCTAGRTARWAATKKRSTVVLPETKNRTTRGSSNAVPGMYPKGAAPLSQRDACTPRSLQHWYDRQGREATWVSTEGWLDEEEVARVCDGLLVSHKEKEVCSSATTCIKPEGIMLSEQAGRQRQIPHGIIYIRNLKKEEN